MLQVTIGVPHVWAEGRGGERKEQTKQNTVNARERAGNPSGNCEFMFGRCDAKETLSILRCITLSQTYRPLVVTQIAEKLVLSPGRIDATTRKHAADVSRTSSMYTHTAAAAAATVDFIVSFFF